MSPAPLEVFACPLRGTRLIEASAGTGKTWNLCGLYLRLLLEKRLEVQGILVVTFTNAATAELRERIRSRIVQTLATLRGSGPDERDPFVDGLLHSLRTGHGLADEDMALCLDQALQTFDEASIFTIHGFCQRALADAPFSAGMPMAQTLLADDSELRLQVVHDFWRRRIAGGALSPALAAHLLERGDSPESLAAVLGQRMAKPLSLLLWPDDLDAALPDAAVDTTALAQAHARARALWRQGRDEVLAIVGDALPRLPNNRYKVGTVAQAARSWDTLLTGPATQAASAGLEKLDLLGSTCLKPKKGHAPMAPHPFFDAAQQLLDARAALAQTLAQARLQLLRELLDSGPPALRHAKRQARVLAFDDMLFNLHDKLAGAAADTGLAAALRTRFPAALIDEFQDTDPLQFAIFNALYGGTEAPLFLVGDPKQAIYSFRNADLHTYLQARAQAVAEYTLTDNQRSTRGLLTALNALFTANPQAFMLPGLAYPPVDYGSKRRAELADRTPATLVTLARAPLQLWTLPLGADGLPLLKPEALQAAARACAAEIARLLTAAQRGDITLGGRALAAGDIAVLVRSHAQGALMRRALAALGVGSVEHSQASVFASPDALELEQLLRGVLEPAREPQLRAALATALLGGEAGALQALAADEAASLAALARFSAYRETWLQRGVGVMLRRLMVEERVSERLLARPDGERRLTNLLHLAECLHEAAATHAAPEALCHWLQAQRVADRNDDALQLRLASDRNLVQIVTIHRSKGLEYPFVFCPFLWDGHPGAGRAKGGGREYHDAQGRPVLDFRPPAQATDKAEDQAIKSQLKLERAAENLRLTYVALTRAVHRCHVVVGPYRTGAHRSLGEGSRGPLSWLAAGAGRSAADWLKSKPPPPQDIAAAWAALAAAHAPHIDLAPLPEGHAQPLPAQRPLPETMMALQPPRHIPAGWAIGSYSSLAQGARHEGAARDHDLRLQPLGAEAGADAEETGATPGAAAPTTPGALPAALADDDILHFPRGAVAGECLHAVFERIDFTDPGTWPVAIEAALAAHPQTAPDAASAARLPRMLQGMLADVLHTPLPGGALLASVPPGRRLVELEFNLPVPHLAAARLSATLREHGYPAPTLAFGTLQGWLRGFIDLVFEHEGRFHVLDWKSNHLGETPADYVPSALTRAMDAQGYHLQYLLYSVALHRHLQLRLPGYRYESHFGGVLYLFVRGVRPGWPGCGVYAHRPTLRAIEQLSALIGAAVPTETAPR